MPKQTQCGMDSNARWSQLAAPFERYHVSDTGRIYDTLRQRYPKLQLTKMVTGKLGYIKVPLMGHPDGKIKFTSVHRLVAIAFVPGDHALDVNHRDTDKTNNHFSNLEWVTHRANILHGLEHVFGWREKLALAGRKRSKAVIATAADGTETRYDSINHAARALGNQNKAGNICNWMKMGRPAYGYKWRYAD